MKQDIRSAVAHLDAPFAVLDLDAALENAADMVRRANGTPIRLASKSIRIRELMKRVLELPGYHGILAYNLTEALWLVESGASDDVVVAYPTANRSALRALFADQHALDCITLVVDSVEHLDFIDAVAPPDQRGEVRLCVDIDASLELGKLHLGAMRSPLHSVSEVRGFLDVACTRPGFKLVGLLAYEGQIAGTTDTSRVVSLMKWASTKELAPRRKKIVNTVNSRLRSLGKPPLEFVNGGGTGSIENTSAEDAVTEIGAGSGIIGSALFDHYKQFTPQPAEWFVLPVVRRPAANTVTVAGGGRVASGPIGKDRLPHVAWPPELSTNTIEGFGEVQTPLSGDAAAELKLGDHVWMRPSKAGEQTEYFDSIVVVSQGRVIDEWATYRGERKSFV